MDVDRLNALVSSLTEAKACELRQAELLVETSNAHKAQEKKWKEANETLQSVQKLLDEFIRDETKKDAKSLILRPWVVHE